MVVVEGCRVTVIVTGVVSPVLGDTAGPVAVEDSRVLVTVRNWVS